MEKKSTQETVKSEKVKPEKELRDGLSQLRDEESIGTIGDDMEDVHDEAIRETLAKDQVEDVRENSTVEPNDQDVREVKETERSKENVASVVVPVVEVAVENSEVKISPDVIESSEPSMVEPSPPSDPSAAKGQGLSLLEQKSDSPVVNKVSVSPVLRTDSGKDDVVSVVAPVDEVAVENREVEASPDLTPSSNPSVVEPSLPSDPSAAKGQGLSLLEQKSDSRVVNNLSASPVLRIDSDKGDVVSVVAPVDEVAVENCEVDTSPALNPSSDLLVVDPSLPSDPSGAIGQGVSLPEQKSDSPVVNSLSVSSVLSTDSGKEDVVSAVAPVDEVSVENREVETPPALSASSDPSVVELSLPLEDPSAAKGQDLSLSEQKSDSPVVNNLSVSSVLRTDSDKGDVISAVAPVNEVAIENREVETSPTLTPSSDPMVEPSLPSDPSAAKSHGPSLLQKSYDSRVVKNLSVSPLLRTLPRDGYNWRKYGQKQVKSPKGSRSYYRCTYSDCCAKKIECSNDSGNMVQIVNKGSHCHEPPRKSSLSPRETRAALAITPVSEEDTVVATVPSDSAPPPSTKEDMCMSPTVVERKRNCENEAVEEPEPKRRLKNDNTQSSDPVSKHGKKHKLVVHASNEVGISNDGYRWRKYGQKMVKGNPNPRNYYRCTSAGCPVRKHIETAVDNTRAVVITYKGEHNHDTPVPKKRHDTPNSVLLSPTSMRTRLDNQVNISPSSSQCSVGRESEKQSSEALDVVGG